MKNFNELTLLFPEMEQKRQESILGGAYGTYYGDDRDNQNPGGYTLAEVTIYATPISTGSPYTGTGPGFKTGGSNGDGNQPSPADGYGSTSGPTVVQALHPEIVDFLVSKFSYSLNSTYAAAEKANFKKILTEMDSSATGDKVLAALDAHYKQFPNERAPTVTDKMPTNGTESYNPTTKELDLGNALLDGNYVSGSVYTVAHELYHDYQNITGQSPLHSNLELDAYMFGT